MKLQKINEKVDDVKDEAPAETQWNETVGVIVPKLNEMNEQLKMDIKKLSIYLNERDLLVYKQKQEQVKTWLAECNTKLISFNESDGLNSVENIQQRLDVVKVCLKMCMRVETVFRSSLTNCNK